MKTILNENIALRSWHLVPWAYLVKGASCAGGLEEEEFELLKRCDGETEIPDSELLQNLMQRRLVTVSDGTRTLSPWQRYRDCDNRYVPMLNLQITGKCNYNCIHCFACEDNAPLLSEMSLEQVTRLLDECVACGVTSFTVTGGEPFVHPHFREILRAIYERGLFIFELNTNGSLVTKEVLEFMKGIGCKPIIKISFDGLGYHDWMRGRKGTEQRTLDAVRLCLAEGFETKVQMNVNRKNKDSVYPTLLLLEQMGVKDIRLIRTTEAPRWEQNAAGQTLSIREYYEFFRELMGKYSHEEHTLNITVWQLLYYNAQRHYYNLDACTGSKEELRLSQTVCTSARSMAAIGADGEVYPCLQMQGFMAERGISFGNVFRDGLKKILTDSKYLHTACLTLEDRQKSGSACKDCRHFAYCHGGCPALALLTHGGDAEKYLSEDLTKCIFLNEGYYEKFTAAFGPENENTCEI